MQTRTYLKQLKLGTKFICSLQAKNKKHYFFKLKQGVNDRLMSRKVLLFLFEIFELMYFLANLQKQYKPTAKRFLLLHKTRLNYIVTL